MSLVATQTGTYSSASDLLTKLAAFLSNNGWSVKDVAGDVIGGTAAQSFQSTTVKAFFSNADGNPNTDWVSPTHERLYVAAGLSTAFSGTRLLFKVARWADFSGGTVPGSSVVSHVNPDDDTGGNLGIKDGANSPSYYFVTDGYLTSQDGSYFIVATEEDPTSPKWKLHYVGLLQSSSRMVRSLTGTFSGSSINLGAAPPAIWNPSLAGVPSIRLRIANQTSTGPVMETVDVLSVAGNVLNLAGPLSGTYTNPIIGNDPQPIVSTLGLTWQELAGSSVAVHAGTTTGVRGEIDVLKPAGLTIPSGPSDITGAQPVYQLAFHNDGSNNSEWMRGGLTDVYYAKMTGLNGDFLKLVGSDATKFQRHVILNLIGDNGAPTDKVLLPFEAESVGV